ncbi:MAG: thioesterase family protein [Burkholderiaceae bacterium]
MTSPAAAHTLEPDFIEGVRVISEEKIVFNSLLGLKITSLSPDLATASIAMRAEFVGHFEYNRIHGGVISAALDAMGGIAVMGAIGARYQQEAIDKRLQRFAKLGTIDLRIDYLRPGIGERFTLSASVLRLGSRVASTRMEFFADNGTLLSTGSGSYIVS